MRIKLSSCQGSAATIEKILNEKCIIQSRIVSITYVGMSYGNNPVFTAWFYELKE